MLIAGNHHLLADAKMLKYIPQYFIRSNFAGDFAEVVEAFADVLGDEFTTEV